MSVMILTINGQPRPIPDEASLEAAIAPLCKNPALVIAELNGAIVDRAQWAATRLKAGDKLELVTFVGGG